MGAESITPPAPGDDKSQNPGDISHSFYHFCMIGVVISNGVLFVSHAIGCFLPVKFYLIDYGSVCIFFSIAIWLITSETMDGYSILQYFIVGIFYFPAFGCTQVAILKIWAEWAASFLNQYRLRSWVGLLVFLGCYCLLPYYRILVFLQGLKEILFWVWDFFFLVLIVLKSGESFLCSHNGKESTVLAILLRNALVPWCKCED